VTVAAFASSPAALAILANRSTPRSRACLLGHETEANPVDRPLGRLAKIRNKPAAEPDSAGDGVSVPGDDEPAGSEEPEPAVSVHTEIQYRLLKLGADMGFHVHVAGNDQSRMWKGQRLGDMPVAVSIFPSSSTR